MCRRLWIVRLVLAAALAAPLLFGQAQAPASAPPRDDDKDVSGTYTFVREGESLQVNVEEERVTGWVSRYGDQESDKGLLIDQFFDKASFQGNKLEFTTKVVHGVWFEFHGTVARGPAKSRAEEGYFVIQGRLKECVTDVNKRVSARERDVEFKLFSDESLKDPSGKK